MWFAQFSVNLAEDEAVCHNVPMGREVWGTVSVKDHCSPNAFVREVLLFDRLVLPVPTNNQERERWARNNWDPDRLDRIREILGTQDVEAKPEANREWFQGLLGHSQRPSRDSLTWDSPWNEARWKAGWSQVKEAQDINQYDAFGATRMILADGKDLPGVIEAVAAFPSRKACHQELKPSDTSPQDPTAAQALLMLSAPLLVPSGIKDKDFGQLRAAADLAREARFRTERQAYYDWMRDFVKPLQSPGHQRLDDIKVDQGSLKLMEERLGRLVTAERELIGRRERRRWWKRTEYALTVIGVAGTAALALTAAFPIIGVGVPIIGLGGWLAGKLTEPHEAQGPLGGASMFVTAQRRLGWQD